ncbi:DUF6529 family protein [Nonomuraea glycinis]|uniref:DUF6529 family protein n=1 Tax=Nonomuraea glycinis TaxID=2047744 RepID=UPI0033B5EA67
MTAIQRPSSRGSASLLVPLFVGGLVMIALGVYGRVNPPTGFAVGVAGFSAALPMKVWLTTGATVLAVVQVVSALSMWGKLGIDIPAGVHRWSGRLAFILTIPVAFHCLYALGLQYDAPRVMVHSLLGCFFYGVFTTKLLSLRKQDAPGWTFPVLGGLAFTALVGLWLTSSFWFFTTIGFKI